MALDIEYKNSSGTWVALPSPVSITTKREQIWSSNTARNSSGVMSGEVIAVKRTFDITWGILTESQYEAIETHIKKGFNQMRICGTVYTVYHDSVEGEYLGILGNSNTVYYKSAKTALIEK